MFDSPVKLLLGLLTGIVFGFLLQKGRVGKFEVIIGQLLLRDWTVVKIMATAVAVGSVGVWALVSMGAATLHVKPALLGGVLVGGLLFGLGLAVFGYCPGTGVAASGAGHRDALIGVGGMLFGAALYVLGYPWLKPMIASIADWGKLTLPEATSSSPWLWVATLVVLLSALLAWIEKRQRSVPAGRASSMTAPESPSKRK